MDDRNWTPERATPTAIAGWRSANVGCAPCSVLDVLTLLDDEIEDSAAALSHPATLRRLRSGEALYHEGAAAAAIHFVRAGTFKTYTIAEDGYEQVIGFALRGELLGFDAICMDRHPTAAVALEESSVYGILVRDLFALGRRIPALDRQLHRATSTALTRNLELADVMAAVSAEVRLARFLVQWSHRMAAMGQSPRRFHLRMSRRDIASHLGVAHETVSRSFTALQGWHMLRVTNRDVEIDDLAALTRFARTTRRSPDERRHAPAGTFDRRQRASRPVPPALLAA